mgnify:CR=1 FL=1
MAFQVSAGVEVKEIDLTNVVPAVSTSIGGYAGQFRWGPIKEITLIGSESELANEFGKPDNAHARSFYTASSFLKYGNALKVVRASNSGLLNSASSPLGGRITSITMASSPSQSSSSGVISSIGSATELGNNIYQVSSSTGEGATVLPLYRIQNIEVASGGTGYALNDEVLVDVGENQNAILKVAAVTDGAPTSLNLEVAAVDAATDSNTPALRKPTKFTNLATVSTAGNLSKGSSGSGLQVNFRYALKSLSPTLGGSGYGHNAGEFKIGVGNGHVVGSSPQLVITKDNVEIYPGTNQKIDGVVISSRDISPTVSASVSAGSGATLIENEDSFENATGLNAAAYSRYAGALGNSTNIYVVDENNFSTLTIGTGTTKVSSQFDAIPGTNEIHVLVTSSADELTDNGSLETVVERWPFLSTVEGAKKEDGTNNYFKDVINTGSNWIYAGNQLSTAAKYELQGGTDMTSREDNEVVEALDLLADSETQDVNLLFTEADTQGSTTLSNKVLSIATARKDCVGFISPAVEDTVNTTTPLDNVLDFLQSTDAVITPRNSYGVLGSTAVYVYDKFNDKFLYIGTQGHLAGLCANTDRVAETWFSPGGFNRGQLRGVTKLAYNPKKADRDELYKAGINPIVTFPGQGTVLFGDKTLQAKPSAFDRINVRRLFITLEKAIATAAKFQLFELNDEFTRAAFRNLVEPFLRDVQGRRGITDFLVVCDETNNTGQVIDSNRFVADIFIKPARSINFITLNFIATRTGVEFSEIVGSV